MLKKSTLDERHTVRFFFCYFSCRIQCVGSFPQLSNGNIPLEEETQGETQATTVKKTVMHVPKVIQNFTDTTSLIQNKGKKK